MSVCKASILRGVVCIVEDMRSVGRNDSVSRAETVAPTRGSEQ